jgi:hypothetical protein
MKTTERSTRCQYINAKYCENLFEQRLISAGCDDDSGVSTWTHEEGSTVRARNSACCSTATPTNIPCPTIDARLFVPVNYRHITTVWRQAPARLSVRPSCIQFASHCVGSARFTRERQPTVGYVILSSRETKHNIAFRQALDGPLGKRGKQARA